jgi:hypothetical protein
MTRSAEAGVGRHREMVSSSRRFEGERAKATVAKRDDDIGDWIDGETSGNGLAVLGWGFGSAVALVIAFASWQYAPARAPGATTHAEITQPDPTEITGSIASTEEGRTSVLPSRGFAAGRFAPLPLTGDETVATSRDIAALRLEIAEIRRRIGQIGLAGDGISRRIDGIEARVGGLAGGPAPTTLPAIDATDATGADAASPVAPTAASSLDEAAHSRRRIADRLPIPMPRPGVDVAKPTPPTAFDADGPATTGAVPRSPRLVEKPAVAAPAAPGTDDTMKPEKAEDRATTAKPDEPPKIASVAPAAVTPKPVDEPAPVKSVRMVATRPAEPPAVPPAAAPVPTIPPAAIDLGGFRSLGSLRRAWSDTAGRHTDLTKGLEPLARLRETDSGIEARLLAGPFTDPTEAAKACLRLKAIGAPCTVTTYTGQPLGVLR